MKKIQKALLAIYLPALLFQLSSCMKIPFPPGHGGDDKKSISERYPHDIGIESDPDVLYVEKFDDGLDNIASRYSDVQNKEGMSLVTDVPAGSKKGSTALKMTSIGGVNSGGHLFRQFENGFDSVIYIRYYVKYPLISKGYMHHEGVWIGGYNPQTGWPWPRAGICGLGDRRLSIAYEPASDTRMDTYMYWGDMKSWNGGTSCYGNAMMANGPLKPEIQYDKWSCIEIMVKLNNPVSESNGELRIWQDGKDVGYWGPGFPNGQWIKDSWHYNESDPPFEGFKWRDDEKLNINYIWIEYYHDESPANAEHHIKYDNLVIAKKYIGPIKK